MADPVLESVVRVWQAEVERRDPINWIPAQHRAKVFESVLNRLVNDRGGTSRIADEYDELSRVLIVRGLLDWAVDATLGGETFAVFSVLDIAKEITEITFIGELVSLRLDAHRLFVTSWL